VARDNRLLANEMKIDTQIYTQFAQFYYNVKAKWKIVIDNERAFDSVVFQDGNFRKCHEQLQLKVNKRRTPINGIILDGIYRRRCLFRSKLQNGGKCKIDSANAFASQIKLLPSAVEVSIRQIMTDCPGCSGRVGGRFTALKGEIPGIIIL